jgi:hypothetical protein
MTGTPSRHDSAVFEEILLPTAVGIRMTWNREKETVRVAGESF